MQQPQQYPVMAQQAVQQRTGNTIAGRAEDNAPHPPRPPTNARCVTAAGRQAISPGTAVRPRRAVARGKTLKESCGAPGGFKLLQFLLSVTRS
jgi:hypothetical protein